MCRVSKYEMVAEKVASYNTDIFSKTMNDSTHIAEFIMKVLKSDSYPVEHMMVFMLDTKLRVVGFSDVSKGILDASFAQPREIFSPAIATPKTACIVIAHNHP